MYNLFFYLGLRHFVAKPGRSLLTLLGVAIGVALFVGIELINASVLHLFEDSMLAIAGRSSLTVYGAEAGFPEDRLDIVQDIPGVLHAVPMIEARAYYQGNDGQSRAISILGVDLLKESTVRTYKTADEQIIDDPLVFLNQPDSIIVTHAFAAEHGLHNESPLPLIVASGTEVFTVRGMLAPQGPGKAYGGGLAIMDIDAARLQFGKEDKLDRIDVVVGDGEDINALAQRIRDKLGPSYHVERPESQPDAYRQMVASFQGVQSFIGSLALLVGLFVVANAMAISVAERRQEIGALRAIGATRHSIIMLVLCEAAVLGLGGACLGLALGYVLAKGLVGFVSSAMVAQFVTPIVGSTIRITWQDGLRALVSGGGVALVSACWPAWLTTRIDPVVALRPQDSHDNARAGLLFRAAPFVGVGALGLLVVAYLARIPSNSMLFRLGGASCTILGSVCLGPWLVLAMARALRSLLARTGASARAPVLRLATENLLRNPARTAATVTSLVVGLILVIAAASIQLSFKETMLGWVNRVLNVDVMVSSTGRLFTVQVQPLNEDLGRALDTVPGVETHEGRGAYGFRFVRFDYQGKSLGLKAFDEPPPKMDYALFDVRDRPRAQAGAELFHGAEPGAMVSENFVQHYGKKTGDKIDIATPSGNLSLRIVGVVTEFASPDGVVYLDRKLYRERWRDNLVTAFWMQARPGVAPSQVRYEVDKRFGMAKGIVATINEDFRKEVTSTINESFSYTHAIHAAALLVGLLGLIHTLLVSILERRREIGMLRAVGMAKRQVSRMILWEGLMQGLLGAIAAVVIGTYVCYLWVLASISSSLGWVLIFRVPWTSVAFAMVAGLGVGVLAGWVGSRRASRIPVREALQYE